MIKKISLYVISFILFSVVAYYLHAIGLVSISNQTPIALSGLYLFHASFSIVLFSVIMFLSENQKYRDQLGFLYIASVVLKLILFFSIFYRPIFKSDAFTNIEGVNLLVPIILFLILEVFLIVKLLNNNSPSKNDK